MASGRRQPRNSGDKFDELRHHRCVPVLLTHVLAFAGAAFLLAMVPGPATAVLLRQTIRHGRRRGVATVAGIEAGVLFWALTAAVGLSALLAASGVAYTVLRIAGTIVLVGLGVQALVRARREKDLPADDEAGGSNATAAELVATEATEPQGGSARAFRAGLLTNIANPKAGVFAISFMPQFIPRHEPVLPVSLLLAVVWIICDGTWFLTLTTVVHAARRVLSRGAVRRRLEAASGVALVGFGLRLASQQR
jgi:threonine/homoserine/homoserine lactone efflux protein